VFSGPVRQVLALEFSTMNTHTDAAAFPVARGHEIPILRGPNPFLDDATPESIDGSELGLGRTLCVDVLARARLTLDEHGRPARCSLVEDAPLIFAFRGGLWYPHHGGMRESIDQFLTLTRPTRRPQTDRYPHDLAAGRLAEQGAISLPPEVLRGFPVTLGPWCNHYGPVACDHCGPLTELEVEAIGFGFLDVDDRGRPLRCFLAADPAFEFDVAWLGRCLRCGAWGGVEDFQAPEPESEDLGTAVAAAR
jgi:hypothetical protein